MVTSDRVDFDSGNCASVRIRITMQHPRSILIVSSRPDPASSNIAQALMAKNGFRKESGQGIESYSKGDIRLVVLEKLGIYAEPSDIPSDVSTTIFVSKHVSSSGRPALTVHATGNLTKEAKFGGNPEEVSYVDPLIIRRTLRALKAGVSQAGVQIDITVEATHHGPTSLSMPVCFVEIGSREKEWKDPVLGEITRICIEGDYAIGHLVSSHSFDGGIAQSMISHSFDKTTGSCNTAIVDWKGLHSNDRRRLIASLEADGREIVRC